MKPLLASVRGWLPVLFLLAALALLSGCNTPDPENQAYRPWGAPKGWENGLPSSMMEGR